MCFPSAEDQEKNDESHFTRRDYASKIFSSIMGRHIDASTIIFVNNLYDVAEFLKSEEHAKHKSNHYIYGSKNVHIRPMDDLPSKTNFTNFFMNKSNKMRLQEFLKTEFQQQVKSFPGRTYIYSVQRECENLHTGLKMADFTCNHQKANTIFFISHILCKHGFLNTIIIDAEDTDVIALSTYAARQSNPKLGIRKKKSTFECFSLCFADLASIIVQIHVLTGAHTTSDFSGRGKKAFIKNVRQNINEAKELLENFGKSLIMTEDCYKSVNLFVIRFVYNDRKSLSLAESCCPTWKQIKKKSTQQLPSDEDSLR